MVSFAGERRSRSMAQRKRGSSPQSRYRRARERVSTLEEQVAKLERSRPRTPGKKGAKTRGLNRLTRQLSSARGWLTKTRNAIAEAKHEAAEAKSLAKQKRSEAARKGHATRRMRAKPDHLAVPGAASDRTMPFLAPDGLIRVLPLGNDRKLVGKYWHAVGRYLENGRTFELRMLEGESIYDALRQQRLPFVTDLQTILEYEAEFDFGASGFYKRRDQLTDLDARPFAA